MTVTPYDLGTYLVSSRSRPGEVEHIVDVIELTCSCEAFMEFSSTNLCPHLEAALSYTTRHQQAKPEPFTFAWPKCLA